MEPVTVTLYTKNVCPQCAATKIKFKKLGIPYEEINVETDPEALAYIKQLGYMQAPVVMLSNGISWAGFRPERIAYIAEGL